ncbi:MAG: nitroreductase family protein, partial [Desulfovibrionales bacterium]|nr:nitroreductase family protein [Desulfovibrionales bacterium]
DTERCIQCSQCVADCPVNIIRFDDHYPSIDPKRESRCLRCMHCLAVCPTGAISILDVEADDCTPLKHNYPSQEHLATLMKGRRSVRRFKDENVAPDVLQQIMDMTVTAPTAKNIMNLQFSLVDDSAVMEKIRVKIYEHIAETVAQDRVPAWLSHFTAFHSAYQNDVDIIFRKAPHMLVVSAPPEAYSPEIDIAIACTHFDLAATNAGLGSLWCGFAVLAFKYFVPDYKELLGIPEGHDALYAMMFGKPAVKYYRTVERNFQKIHTVQWNE